MPKAKKHNIEVYVALLRGGLFQRDIGGILGLSDFYINRTMSEELPADVQNTLIYLITKVAKKETPTEQDRIDVLKLREYFLDINYELSDRIDDRTINFVEGLLEKKREFDDWTAEFNDLCDKFD